MTGKLGEDFFKIITLDGRSLGFEIDLTGMMSEQQMQNNPNIRGKLTGILTTHHSSTKES